MTPRLQQRLSIGLAPTGLALVAMMVTTEGEPGALPLGHNHPFVMERVQAFLQSGHVLQGLDARKCFRDALHGKQIGNRSGHLHHL